MARRVHAVARDAADRLGFAEPFTLYQTPKDHSYTGAQALLGEQPFAVRLIGPVARLLDDAALRALIGHEFGHGLAHGPRAEPPSRILSARDYAAPAEILRLCDVAAELSAERFAVIAAGEIEALVRLEVASRVLDSPDALGVREMEYLTTVCRDVERGAVPLFVRSGPTLALRLYADWLFWPSDAYRELTGTGPGELRLRDVDARLRALCEAASNVEPLVSAPVEIRLMEPSVRAAATAIEPGDGDRHEWGASARAVARSLAARVGDVADRAARHFMGEPERNDRGCANADPLDDLGDCEARLRALEAAAAGSSLPSETPNVSADLEARFRALEDAARSESDRSEVEPAPDRRK